MRIYVDCIKAINDYGLYYTLVIKTIDINRSMELWKAREIAENYKNVYGGVDYIIEASEISKGKKEYLLLSQDSWTYDLKKEEKIRVEKIKELKKNLIIIQNILEEMETQEMWDYFKYIDFKDSVKDIVKKIKEEM